MMERSKLHDAVSKCAWGYFFLHFNINLGTVSILPDFVGFLLFYKAIDLLKREERELELLRPLTLLLAIWNGIHWLGSWFGGISLEGIPVLGLIMVVISLYFHFQFLTNLASIAGRYQSGDADFDQKLLRNRTWQVVLFTVMQVIGKLSVVFGEVWFNLYVVLTFVQLCVAISIIYQLFRFRKDIEEPN